MRQPKISCIAGLGMHKGTNPESHAERNKRANKFPHRAF